MKTIKATFEDGNYIVTNFNCENLEEAERYYLGNFFNIGAVEDDVQKCIKVELLENFD